MGRLVVGRSFFLVLVAAAASMLAAPSCGSSNCEETRSCAGGGNAGSDGGKPDASSSFTVSLDKPAVTLVAGGTATVKASVVRTGTASDVTLSPSGLPSGVTVTPLSIPAAQTSANLTLTAASDATQGSSNVKLTCKSGSDSHDALFSLAVQGAPGSLDTTFGSGGYVIVPWAADRLVGPVIGKNDSLTLLATHATTLQALELKRFTAEGQPDQAFATGGTLWFPSPFDNNPRYGTALIDDGTGRLLTGDIVTANSTVLISVVRFDSSGGLDQSFGTSGEIGGASSALQGAIWGLAVDPNGKIILAGAASNPPMAFLGRATDAGPDPSFGTSGGANFSSSGQNVVRGVALPLADGSYFGAFGLGNEAAPSAGMVVRADANGKPVTGFGVDSIVNVSMGVNTAVHTGGKIVLGGTSIGGAVQAVNEDGTPDSSFGTAGTTTVGVEVLGLATDSQNRILAAATQIGAGWALARMDASGKLDDAFGKAGVSSFLDAVVPFGVATQSDGRIVVALVEHPPNGAAFNLRIARIWP